MKSQLETLHKSVEHLRFPLGLEPVIHIFTRYKAPPFGKGISSSSYFFVQTHLY